jgi:hypothetical protein
VPEARRPAPPLPAPPLPAPPPDAPADKAWEDQTAARPPRRTDFDEPEGTEVMPAPEREAAVDAIKRHRIMRQRALSGTDDALGQSAPSRKRRGSSLGLVIVVVIAFFAGATLVAVLSVPGLAPPWLRDIVDRVSATGPKPAPAPQPPAASAPASPDATAPSPSVQPPADASSAEPVATASASASASASATALSGAAGAASTAVAGQGGAPTEPATP